MRFVRPRADGLPTPPARIGGLLVCAGAAMSLVLSLTNSAYSAGRPELTIVPSLIALLFGATCVIAGSRTPTWALALVPAVAGALIIVSMWITDTPLDGSQLLLVWCAFFAGYFLTPWPAAISTGLIGAGYSVMVLVKRGVSVGAPSAVYLSTTLGVACFLVAMLRRRAAASLSQARAEARTDHLTGLLNRRGLGEVWDRELERAQRAQRPLSAWMIDLDHFKALNDALGHAAGDRALEDVADVLRDQLRGVDVIARVGGEEFCVLLPNCTTADAFLRAEVVREALAERFRSRDLAITVSIGVATWTAGDLDGSALTAAADQALYAAKAAGRNQTQVAHGVPAPRRATAGLG